MTPAVPKMGPVIAIDGPAGTGKSTATRRLCDALGFTHVDTGALYRAIAYLWLQGAGDPGEEGAVAIARSAHLELRREPAKSPPNRVLANGKDVTELIRTPEVSMGASRVAAFPGVRGALLGLQRRLGCAGRTVLEGRDIGTVVFPDADVKFFLVATADERAKRRLAELAAAGKAEGLTLDEVRRQIVERDSADSSRSAAPLRRADDAIEVDTTGISLEEVVSRLERLARERLGAGAGVG